MKITSINAKNFMIFNDINLKFSKDINVISGANSTGKTALLKLLYASLKGYDNAYNSMNRTKELVETEIVKKLCGVFRPDKNAVGRLVNRVQGSNRTDLDIVLDDCNTLEYGFSSRHTAHIDIKNTDFNSFGKVTPVYIPPKEIISATENFDSLYSDYHIAFEETYDDLTRLLARPLKKGANSKKKNRVLDRLEKIIDGNIIQKDRKFYIHVRGEGEFEMGLVSEGYRKLATIMYLISSGTLSSDSILFWDEPETNMNPKMIQPIAEAMIELARMGVQIFVTTHDYFLQQSFNLDAVYSKGEKNKRKVDYEFISLYKDDEGIIRSEVSKDLSLLEHNDVMEEFDAIYNREQGMIYGN